jgi:AcrR family transcriptional regulator
MTATPPRTLRADAERNRRLLLDAAAEAFAQSGLDVSVAEIARRAGVGHGTAFRRFPTKDLLVLAVIADRLETLRGVAQAQLDGEPDPWRGIAGFVEAAVQLHVADRGLFDAVVHERLPLDGLLEHKRNVLDVVGQLLARAQAAGVVRSDVTAMDVPVLVQCASQAGCQYRELEPELWRRYVALLLDSLRPEGARPLPVAAPTIDDVDQAGCPGGR